MQITPLPQGFGAVISDFDRLDGRDPADVARLQQAFIDHHLVVFRGHGEITPERQMEITAWFGPIITEGKGWTVLDNADPTGRLELEFHSDITFMEFPLEGISLYPQELPRNETSTTYVSNAVAWRALPEELQADLQDRKGRHYFESQSGIHLGLTEFEHWHPLRLNHPQSGEPLLFATRHHTDRIEGMSEERSAEVLAELFAQLYAPERRYEHVWQLGDLVIWNNLAVQHARTKVADPADGPRIMRRVQLARVSFPEQLRRLRSGRGQHGLVAVEQVS